MKNLLLVVKTILVITLLTACSSSKNKKTPTNIQQDVNNENDTPRAIIHPSSEQAKLDSIKAAKEKLRKKK